MKKEIFKRESIYGSNGDKTMALHAEYDYDLFAISQSDANDGVRISVKDCDTIIHQVFISFDDLEAIYIAAKKAKNNR